MCNNRGIILLCVVMLVIGIMVGVNIPYIFPSDYKSDEEIYQEMLVEFERYMKIGGIWEKQVNDVPVHLNNHKDRVMFEIDNFRRIACNGTH